MNNNINHRRPLIDQRGKDSTKETSFALGIVWNIPKIDPNMRAFN